MYKMIELSARVSPLHNKFKIDSSEALKQVEELLEMRRQSIERTLAENRS